MIAKKLAHRFVINFLLLASLGLDCFQAEKVIELLQSLAKQGDTVLPQQCSYYCLHHRTVILHTNREHGRIQHPSAKVCISDSPHKLILH
jgi:hypothetical protein